MRVLREAADRAMKSKLARWLGGSRTNGGAVNPYKAATKGYAAGGAVDMGSIGGAPAPTNLGRASRGRPKGSKNKAKGKGKKGGTNVNVVVMPKEAGLPVGAVPPPGLIPPPGLVPPPVIAPPMPPPGPTGPIGAGAPPGLMGLGGPPPPDAMGMGAGPPPMMRADGGSVAEVSDENARRLRSKGSGASADMVLDRADGGKVDLPRDQDEGGAGSGVGRLGKVKDSKVEPGKAISV